jgi:hypothetical protein
MLCLFARSPFRQLIRSYHRPCGTTDIFLLLPLNSSLPVNYDWLLSYPRLIRLGRTYRHTRRSCCYIILDVAGQCDRSHTSRRRWHSQLYNSAFTLLSNSILRITQPSDYDLPPPAILHLVGRIFCGHNLYILGRRIQFHKRNRKIKSTPISQKYTPFCAHQYLAWSVSRTVLSTHASSRDSLLRSVYSAALIYFGIMMYIVLGILNEVRPVWYYVISAILFVLSQLDYFLLSKIICKVRPPYITLTRQMFDDMGLQGSSMKIDGSFVATILETASVAALYFAWRGITEGNIYSSCDLNRYLFASQRTGATICTTHHSIELAMLLRCACVMRLAYVCVCSFHVLLSLRHMFSYAYSPPFSPPRVGSAPPHTTSHMVYPRGVRPCSAVGPKMTRLSGLESPCWSCTISLILFVHTNPVVLYHHDITITETLMTGLECTLELTGVDLLTYRDGTINT